MRHLFKSVDPKILSLCLMVIIFVVLIIGVVFIYQKQITPKNLTTFEDKEIPGFSFKYNPEKWIVNVEDIKYCGEIGCTESKGRFVKLTHKQFETFPKTISLDIRLEKAEILKSVVTGGDLCFNNNEVMGIGGNWYKVVSIYEVPGKNKDWTGYFIRERSFRDKGGKKCIAGGLNLAEQPVLPVKFHGEPLILNAVLYNKVSEDLNNIADDIVKSISFK